MFGRHWVAARGTVVAKRTVSTSGDGMVTIPEFVVDVRMPDGELFRAKVEEPRIATDFKDPSVGDEVSVEVETKHRKVRFDKDDPALSWKAYKKSLKSSFEQTLAAPAGTPPVGGLGDHSIAQIQALMQSAHGNVIRLDASDPANAALRESLLRAVGSGDLAALTGQSGQPDQGGPGTPSTQSLIEQVMQRALAQSAEQVSARGSDWQAAAEQAGWRGFAAPDGVPPTEPDLAPPRPPDPPSVIQPQ